VDFTVDDPNTFNMPWSGVAHYRRSRGGYEEFVCAENNMNIWTGKSYPIPIASVADFWSLCPVAGNVPDGAGQHNFCAGANSVFRLRNDGIFDGETVTCYPGLAKLKEAQSSRSRLLIATPRTAIGRAE
jgi:hypothetical protein